MTTLFGPEPTPRPEQLTVCQVAPILARLLPIMAAEAELERNFDFDMRGIDKPVVWLCEGAPGGRWAETVASFTATFAIVKSDLDPPSRTQIHGALTPGWVSAVRRAAMLLERMPVPFKTLLPDGAGQDWRAGDYRAYDRQGREWGLSPTMLASAFAPIDAAALRNRPMADHSLTYSLTRTRSLCNEPLVSMRTMGTPILTQGSALLPVCAGHFEFDDQALLDLFLGLDISRTFVIATMPDGNAIWLPKEISDELLMFWDQYPGS